VICPCSSTSSGHGDHVGWASETETETETENERENDWAASLAWQVRVKILDGVAACHRSARVHVSGPRPQPRPALREEQHSGEAE
jgi:hypothetical protein